MDSNTSIGGLFCQRNQFCVPSYQRAYSWEVDAGVNVQVAQFLSDIKEHNPSRKYFLGHFLFSRADSDKREVYEVIDGQQRLTTVVIFMSCLIAECRRRGMTDIDGIEIDELVETYLIHRFIKFLTVAEDRSFFEDRIVRMDEAATTKTSRSSERRISKAANYFAREFKKCTDAQLCEWGLTIHNARVTTFVIEGESAKEVATQVFAFQNDRGKSLTNLEVVKAFLMNKVYQCSEDAEGYIPSIESAFASIYAKSELIKNPEDRILGWHCQAFLPAADDSAVDAIKAAMARSKEKDRWAVNFSTRLAQTFDYIIQVEYEERYSSGLIPDLCFLDQAHSMPLLIKLHHIGVLEDRKMKETVLRMIEAILFKMTFTVGGFRKNDLVDYALKLSKENFDTDFMPKLRDTVQKGFMWYWDFNGDCLRFFTERRSHYQSNIKYVLYKYENWLRDTADHPIPRLTPNEYRAVFSANKRVEHTLDHITPVQPSFTTYSDEFVHNWLNNIGNLSLLTWSANSSKKDNNPVNKEVRRKYALPYLSQREIYDVLCKGKWGKDEIDARRERIIKFVRDQWGV